MVVNAKPRTIAYKVKAMDRKTLPYELAVLTTASWTYEVFMVERGFISPTFTVGYGMGSQNGHINNPSRLALTEALPYKQSWSRLYRFPEISNIHTKVSRYFRNSCPDLSMRVGRTLICICGNHFQEICI